MTPAEPALPIGQMTSRVAAATPAIVNELAKTTVRQYMVGLLVQPEHVMCSEVLLSVRPGISLINDRIPNTVLYRLIYQAELPGIGRQFWMVVLGTHEPFDGEIDETCEWSRAAFYVYGEFGWDRVHEYAHRLTRRREQEDHSGAFPDPLDPMFSTLQF